MKKKEQLVYELETPEGWKSIMGGWFKGLRAKKRCESYKNADKKGVADFIMLRKVTHDDYYYAVGVFSTSNELTDQMIEDLKETINQFPVNQIRYEAYGTNGFYEIVSDQGEYYSEDYAIHQLTEDMQDVYIVVYSDSNKEGLDCPYVVYKHQEGAMHVRPVNRKYL